MDTFFPASRREAFCAEIMLGGTRATSCLDFYRHDALVKSIWLDRASEAQMPEQERHRAVIGRGILSTYTESILLL